MAFALRVVSKILRLNRRFCGSCVASAENLVQKFMEVVQKFDG